MTRRLLLFTSASILVAISACSADEASPISSPAGDLREEPKDAGTEGDAVDPPLADPADAGADVGSPRFEDTCDLQKSVCTAAPAGFKEGSGLAAIDRCAFALGESAGLGAVPALVAALEKITTKVSVAAVLDDANRTATKTDSVPGSPPGVAYAFRWQNDDDASKSWIPQGITGTADADPTGKIEGKSAVLVSFYHEPPAGEADRGVRIAFVDTTAAAQPKYRFALLVRPKGTPEAPSFDPVDIHAGGIAWFGDYLYVASTTRGLLVFDMRHVLRVATDQETFGCNGGTCWAASYKYVIPQVGAYDVSSSCTPRFSFVSLDRQSNPPALVSGEYCSKGSCPGPLTGRVFRWPLDPETGLLRSTTTFPVEAYLMSHKQVQGAASVGSTYYLSSSAPAGGAGALYRVAGKKSATSRWSDSPEDLMVDHGANWLWSLSEHANARAVYAVKRSSYPDP